MTTTFVRADGYTQHNASVICTFQAEAERNPACDYERLRKALRWARERSYDLTVEDLWGVYFRK